MAFPDSLNIPLYGIRPEFQQLGYTTNAKLVIERQPRKRGYRFRYASEGKTHGMLPGEGSSKQESEKKIFPTIRLENHQGPAKVVMTLVSDRDPYKMHAHTLLMEKEPVAGYCVFDIGAGEMRKELKSIAIQHAVKDTLQDTLADRILQTRFAKQWKEVSYMKYGSEKPKIDIHNYIAALADRDKNQGFVDRKTKIELTYDELEKLKTEAKELAKSMNMSACRLCFVTFLQDNTGNFQHVLDPVYSDEIIDGKKKEGAPLKIIRTSHVAGSVEGGKEIWLLSDKVDADDTEVHFWEKKDQKEGISWEGLGEFVKTDVYKQALIVFKTPAYCDKNIDQPRSVNMQLRRKKDRNCVSDIHQFTFKPVHYDRYGLREKRRKKIPDGIYQTQPPPKRKAMDRSADNISHPFNGDGGSPANPADETDNPTLSDFVFQSLKGEPVGNGSGESPSTSTFNFPSALMSQQWPSNPVNQFLSNYQSSNDSGDETRGS